MLRRSLCRIAPGAQRSCAVAIGVLPRARVVPMRGVARVASAGVARRKISSLGGSNTDKVAATVCPGCGAPFQSTDPGRPGYLVSRETDNGTAMEGKRASGKGLDQAAYEDRVSKLDAETQKLLLNSTDEDEAATNGGAMDQTPLGGRWQADGGSTRTVCQRCHQLTHHNRKEPVDLAHLKSTLQYSSLGFLRTKQQPLVVCVLDVTDMPWSLYALEQLVALQPHARVLVAANKVDLLPRDALKHEQRLRDAILSAVRQRVGNETFELVGGSVSLMSAIKGWGVKSLLKRVQDALLPSDDVYVVGCVNAGKSAFIHRMLSLSRASDRHQYRPTSSKIPGTTLGSIHIPLHTLGLHSETNDTSPKTLRRQHHLIDTPGMLQLKDHAMHPHALLTPEQQQQVLSKNRREALKPVTFKVKPGQSLLLGRARIDVVDATMGPVLCTLFSMWPPHFTKTAKLPQQQDTADSLPAASQDKDAWVPVGSLQIQSQHRRHATADLCFAGLGWVALTGDFGHASLKIWLPNDVSDHAFYLRDPPFLPFEYRGQIRKFFGAGHRAMQ